MYTLYYFPGNASFAPHVLLQESGAAHQLKLVDRKVNAHKESAYLSINPAGRIPAFEDGDLVMYEAAAVCLHLCDLHPEMNMAPDAGSKDRGIFYKWLMFLTNSIQPDVLQYYYTDRYTTDPAGIDGVKQSAKDRVQNWFDIIENTMGDGPYLLGASPSAVDVYLLMVSRWSRFLDRPPKSMTKIGPLLERMLERPAVKKAIEVEGIEGPFLG
jgi:glutathione S-transferase